MALIRVGVVSHRRPETNVFFVRCIALASKFGSDLVWHVETNADVSPSRNRIISQLKEPYLLLLDDDMEFNYRDLEKILKQLIENPEMGALSALYYKWDGSGLPVVNFLDDENEWMDDESKREKVSAMKGTQPVDGFGGGFLLIDSQVFNKISPPYFQAGYGLLGRRKFEYMSNDTYFCQKLKDAGYNPSVDFDVVLNHWGMKSFSAPEVKDKVNAI